MKKCHKCKELKNDADFFKNKVKIDGLGTECKSCRKIYMTKYYIENQEKLKKDNNYRNKKRHHNAKLLCIQHYSNETNQCKCCNEKTPEFLSVNHINGGGNKDRENFRGARTFYEYLVKENFPEGFNILCFNCNLALGFLGYCPHKERTK